MEKFPLLAVMLILQADETLKEPAMLLSDVLLCEKMSKLLLVVAVMLLNAYSDMVLLLAASENVPVVANKLTLKNKKIITRSHVRVGTLFEHAKFVNIFFIKWQLRKRFCV